MTDQEYMDIYWAAKPPEVRKLHTAFNGYADERKALCTALALKGFLIDYEIDCFSYMPNRAMEVRKSLGWKWFPSFLQYLPPEQYHTLFDATMGGGGIMTVDTDEASWRKAYPPFDPPPPPPPPEVLSDKIVGEPLNPPNGKEYQSLAFKEYPDGMIFTTETKGTFKFVRVKKGPWIYVWLEKVI